MTNQEFFTQAAVHLLTQNEQAINYEDGACQYRTYNEAGTRLACAVGGVMPDEVANEVCRIGKNGTNINTLMLECQSVRELLGGVHPNLLTDVQRVHDLNQPHDWPELLAAVARQYGLDIPTTLEERLT